MEIKKKEIVTVYKPNKSLDVHFFISFYLMFSGLFQSVSLGWRIFVRDIKAKYQQQIAGVLWVVIGPGVAVLTYTLLARARVLNITGVTVPYPLYAFLSVSLWGIVQTTIIEEAKVINNSAAFITKINFHREALLYSPLLTCLVDLSVRLVLFGVICAVYRYSINPLNFIYIFFLVPGLLFSLGIGMFFSIVGAVFKDIAVILTYFFQFLLFVTPIMYPLPRGSVLGIVAEYNPLYYLIVVPRDLLLYGETPQMTGFLYCSLIGVGMFLIGLRFYTIAVSRIIEKI